MRTHRKMLVTRVFLHTYMQLEILFIISLILPLLAEQRVQRPRFRLCSRAVIPNADVSLWKNKKIIRVKCLQGFTLQGSQTISCEKGKWIETMPVCTKEGCTKPENPLNGLVLDDRFTASLYCNEKYKVAGSRVTYCNGTHWDRPLGICRESNDTIQLTCDFESDDLCGWSHDVSSHFFWKRIMAANIFKELRTGPQHDHTTLTANSGHYMLMESFDQNFNSVARLVSPIYSMDLMKYSGCFKFYYFMYGATVGSLNVYVKPLSVDINNMLPDSKYFSLSGNQKNIWREAVIDINQMTEDFQIVIEGTTGSDHLSDIAVDDVQLMTYSECNPNSTMSTTKVLDHTEIAIYDIQSCEGRCGEVNSTGYGIKNKGGKMFKMCDCHSDCEDLQTCCLNYRLICELENWETSTLVIDSSTTINVNDLLSTKASTVTLLSTQITSSIKSLTQTTQNTTLNKSTSTEASDITNSTSSSSITPAVTIIKPTAVKTTKNTKINTHAITTLPNTTMLTTSSTGIEKILTTESIEYGIQPINPTSEKTLGKRNEKVITWKVDHSSKPNNMHPARLILFIILSVLILITIITLLLKYHGYIRRFMRYRLQRYDSNDYSDTARLTYNQGNDIILQN